MKSILLCFVMSFMIHAEEPAFIIQRWIAAVEPTSAKKSSRLPLGVPLYVSPTNFLSQYHQPWMTGAAMDYMTMARLPIRLGQSTGTDDFGSTFLTNRAAEQFPIPTNQPGLYWRIRADKTAPPITLHCAFTLDYTQTNRAGEVIARKASFQDTLRFTNNQVAIIRLPTINYETRAPRQIFGFSFGEKTEQETRELYVALTLTNLPLNLLVP